MRKAKILFFILFFSLIAYSETIGNFYLNAAYPSLRQIDIKTKRLKVADLVINIKPESKIFLMVAGKTPVGVAVFNASYSYNFSDRYFMPVAMRNYENALDEKPDVKSGILHIEGDARYTFIWNLNIGFALSRKRQSSLVEFPQEVKDVFKGLQSPLPSLSVVFQSLFKNPSITSVYIHSKSKKLLYRIDPVNELTETLDAVLPYPPMYSYLKDKFYTTELTVKTLKKSWFMKDSPLFTVFDTRLKVVNDREEHIDMNSVQKVRFNINGISCYYANLISKRYSKTFRKYNVKSVKVNGKKADFFHSNGLLFVKLERNYNAGEVATIEVECEGDIAIHPNGDNYFSLGTYPWYPQPDLSNENSTFEILVKAPKDYSVFATGKVIDRGVDGKYTFVKTRLDKHMQFPVIAAGKYHVYSNEYNGYRCTVASYAMAKKKHALRLANNFFVAEDFYSRLFGFKYPFKEQQIVEVNSWGFGQAPPGLIFITQEAFSPLRDYFSRFFSEGINQRFVHEVSHAFWGHVAKIPNNREMWISEALAQYSSALCMEFVQKNRKKGEKVFNKMVKNWYAQTKLLGRGSVLFFAQDFSGETERDSMDRWKLIYNKGPLVIHGIRMKLRKQYGDKEGDRLFVIFLKALVRNGNFNYIYTADMIGILNQLTKTDWTPYFEKYVLGTSIPEV